MTMRKITPSPIRENGKTGIQSQVSRWAHNIASKKVLFYFKIHGGQYQKEGMPDCLFIKDGKYLWIEIKAPETGELSDVQEMVIADLRHCGADVHVATSLDEVKALVTKYLGNVEIKPSAIDRNLRTLSGVAS
jgi:hypothetical protein